MNDLQTKKAIEAALNAFANRPLADAAIALFESLGYVSKKRLRLTPNTAEKFLATYGQNGSLNGSMARLDQWQTVDFLFQLTDDEIIAAGPQKMLFESSGVFDGKVIDSYLFFALELKESRYTRASLAGITRELNKLFPMPALVLFKHGDTISLATINRRQHKRDLSRDVLEKVTLIKDIAIADPIRAHLEILADFALTSLDADYGVSNFVALHAAWQKRLGSYALSNDFYREIADWYFWAHHLVNDGIIQLPRDCDTEQERALFLIRLLTRVIFCWFLVEKRLVPPELFRENTLKDLLQDLSPSVSTYYHAVLQNLFFGTLNMPSEQRSFRERKTGGQRFDKNYGIANLWRHELDFHDASRWSTLAARVPFLNGGLFDCLDDKTGVGEDISVLDGFSDNPRLSCHLPNDLFFGRERLVDLSKDYGDENSRNARSKRAKVRGLIEILSRYKFTIEENTPLEEEIALDPELLGKVFENLLASYNEDTRTTARRALGAFYTPREIVSYMVDEALKSYLATKVPDVKELLSDLFAENGTPNGIKPDQRDELIAAIGRVKILDPACGSGAFPMGALHRLVNLLQKLDPNNESWKRDRLAEANRYRKLLEASGAPREEMEACDARVADIAKSFDTRFHALDFARKLYLIENAIYGVDIQPIAVQIAKLRFFIALVVDQKVDLQAPNLGVRPLPNLETRLVAADTLVPIERAESDLFSGEVDRLRGELAAIRHEHFNARDPRNKRRWRDADSEKRREIAIVLERDHAIRADAARQLATWDPYDQNAYAPFFDSEWMFGLSVGKLGTDLVPPGNLAQSQDSGEVDHAAPGNVLTGFDIVIGNPPYVSKQNIQRRFPIQYKHLKQHYQTASGRDFDLFGCFIEKAIGLLRVDGVLSFIVASGWYTGPGFGMLRRFVARQTDPLSIVNLPYDVFAAAWVDTTIIVCRRRSYVTLWPRTEPSSTKIRNFEKHERISDQRDFDRGAKTVDLVPWFESGSDVFLTRSDPITIGLLRAIEMNSVPVRELADIQRGITPFDLTDAPIHANSREAFNGTVRRYKLDRGPKCFIRFDETLAEFKPERYFVGDRILLRELISRKFEIQAAFASEPFVTNKSMQTILANDPKMTKFLLGCINCKVVSWVFLQRSNVAHRDDFPKIVLKETRALPIPICDRTKQATVGLLVDALIRLHYLLPVNGVKADNPRDPLMLAYFDQMLNGLMYELYLPENVQEAGLGLFELVEQVARPAFDSISASNNLADYRRTFEVLYDGTNPIKIGLQKLQTLDIVRTIEGKA